MKKSFAEWMFERRAAIFVAIFLMAFLCTPLAALAGENDLPWNSALEKPLSKVDNLCWSVHVDYVQYGLCIFHTKGYRKFLCKIGVVTELCGYSAG